ncbi:MAG: competence/damage-inducible protein A [Candidatus Cloacimonetes bacterium]|nr:competence/damage-inducible protein A [Candidatus Cloacimonadota bacterium]
MYKSAVLTIGNEILLGSTLNTNLAWLAQELAAIGLPVDFSLTVKDEPEAISQALALAWEKCDVVITTGGLGPTEDDITKNAIASFFDAELMFDPAIWEEILKRFAFRKMKVPESNRSQAMVPKNFMALKNDRGTAPGLFFEDGSKSFFAFAGVPLEMRHLFENQAKPLLLEKYGNDKQIWQHTLHTFGISESALAELLADFPKLKGVELAWLPQSGRVDLRFYGPSKIEVTESAERCHKLIEEYVWGENGDTPAQVLLEILKEKGWKLALAESCTGGWAQKMITDVPGASESFLGGVVSYANELKQALLGVNSTTLMQHGAVSEKCAQEMAEGIKSLTKSQIGISVTGVAGPDGGTVDKPVGTVCFGFSDLQGTWSFTHAFNGDRESIRFKAAEYALLSLIKHLRRTIA